MRVRAFLAAAFSTTHASAEAGFFRRHRAASRRPGQSKNSTPCYVVRDHNGQQLACVYFEDEPGRGSAAKPLTRDEARRIAANVTKLPEMLRSKTE